VLWAAVWHRGMVYLHWGACCGRRWQVAVAVRGVHEVDGNKEVAPPQHRLVRTAGKLEDPLDSCILCASIVFCGLRVIFDWQSQDRRSRSMVQRHPAHPYSMYLALCLGKVLPRLRQLHPGAALLGALEVCIVLGCLRRGDVCCNGLWSLQTPRLMSRQPATHGSCAKPIGDPQALGTARKCQVHRTASSRRTWNLEICTSMSSRDSGPVRCPPPAGCSCCGAGRPAAPDPARAAAFGDGGCCTASGSGLPCRASYAMRSAMRSWPCACVADPW
jgi:hypothetical protein